MVAERGEFRGSDLEHVGEVGEWEKTSTRRFPANQIPALRFHALLNEEAPEVNLMPA
jgi:hypothetical protein